MQPLWFEAFVSVRFDLEYGPLVEHVVPEGALTDEGRRSVAKVGFPDCNPDVGHDFIYHFIVPVSILAPPPQAAAAEASAASASPSMTNSFGSPLTGSPASLPATATTAAVTAQSATRDGVLFGTAYYRQKRDASCPRGYVQQSLITLTRLPYLILRELVVRVMAPPFGRNCAKSPDIAAAPTASALLLDPVVLFGCSPRPDEFTSPRTPAFPGSPVFAASPLIAGPVDAAAAVAAAADPVVPPAAPESQLQLMWSCWSEVAAWPSPHPHVEYNLSLRGCALHFVTPPAERHSGRYLTVSPSLQLDDRVKLLGGTSAPCHSLNFLPLHAILRGHIQNLTKVWELLIAHEPLLILSNTPSMSSAVAMAVVALISPLRFSGEFRPYLTVQDAAFANIAALGKSPGCAFPPNQGFVVAGTNPYFVRALSGWKNAMSVSDPHARQLTGGGGSLQRHERQLSSGGGSLSGSTTPTMLAAATSERSPGPSQPPETNSPITTSGATATPSSPLSSPLPPPASSSSATSPVAEKGEKSWESLLWGFKEVFTTKRKFVLDHKEHLDVLSLRLTQAGKVPPGIVSSFSRSLPVGCVSAADEMVRKFFFSLTTEFLSPLVACFNSIAQQTAPFQLCCATAAALFPTAVFLKYISEYPLPSMFSKRKRKEAVVLYESFIHGSLFTTWLRDTIDAFVKAQVLVFDASAEVDGRSELYIIDMFINLQRYVAREECAVDPDVVLVSAATAALAELAMHVREPLRNDLLSKLDNVRLRF